MFLLADDDSNVYSIFVYHGDHARVLYYGDDVIVIRHIHAWSIFPFPVKMSKLYAPHMAQS